MVLKVWKKFKQGYKCRYINREGIILLILTSKRNFQSGLNGEYKKQRIWTKNEKYEKEIF